MTLAIDSTIMLNNGIPMPQFGLGVYLSKAGEETQDAVAWALEAGYRHIDTATIYRNESDVGVGLRRSGVDRGDVFITTKVWNSDQGFTSTLEAMDTSLERLGMEYVDLYLIHWPQPALMQDTWRAMEAIYEAGKAKAIGVSNFLVSHLEQLFEFAEVMPAVDQIEFHPHLQQPQLQGFLRAHDVRLTAWSPLKQGAVIEMPELVEIGERHGKSAVQVTVRWLLQQGVIAIPKSVREERIVANAEVYDFELSDAEMAAIDALDCSDRIGPHPDFFP